jgi:predicted ester cyclase
MNTTLLGSAQERNQQQRPPAGTHLRSGHSIERQYIRRRQLLGALVTLSLPLPAVVIGEAPLHAASLGSSSRKLLQDFIDALTSHDMKRFRSLYVDDGYVQHQLLVTNAPSSSGPDAAVAYFAKRIEAFPDLAVTSDVSFFDGDMIAANLIWSGTHRGEYLGIAPTGNHVTFNSTDIMKVRDGLFAEHWGAADLFGLIQQLRA